MAQSGTALALRACSRKGFSVQNNLKKLMKVRVAALLFFLLFSGYKIDKDKMEILRIL